MGSMVSAETRMVLKKAAQHIITKHYIKIRRGGYLGVQAGEEPRHESHLLAVLRIHSDGDGLFLVNSRRLGR